jgi:DNA-binding MarR family transcriptional regulator
MLFLRQLPSEKAFKDFAERYPEMDPSATMCCGLLLLLSGDMIAALERYLGQHKLSQGRFYTLLTLLRFPEKKACPSELAKRIGVTRATLTGFVNGLEKDGLVVREVNREDRRKILVHLTSEGNQKLESVIPEYYRRVRLVLQVLSEEERSQLMAFISQIHNRLNSLKF